MLTSFWLLLIIQHVQTYGKYLNYQVFEFDNSNFAFFLVFPAWEPNTNDVMCAKFVYYYRTKCFNKQVENIDRIKQGETGPKRLQGNILFQGHGSLFKA